MPPPDRGKDAYTWGHVTTTTSHDVSCDSRGRQEGVEETEKPCCVLDVENGGIQELVEFGVERGVVPETKETGHMTVLQVT